MTGTGYIGVQEWEYTPEILVRVSKLLKGQKGKCAHCNNYFKDGDSLLGWPHHPAYRKVEGNRMIIGNYSIDIATTQRPPMMVVSVTNLAAKVLNLSHQWNQLLGLGKRYVGNDVLMTTAVLLRSGMMGNYHVPFWRAVKEATPSLTLIIAVKVVATLGLCLKEISRGALLTPLKVPLWNTSRIPSMNRWGVSTIADASNPVLRLGSP